MDRIKMGEFLTDLRKERDLSQADLAEIIGVTYQAVSKWERGEAIPDIAILEKLASLYTVSIDEIIKGEADKKDDSLPEKERIELGEEEPITPKKNTVGFLSWKRTFGFWFGLSYFIFLILFGLCPFTTAQFGSWGDYETFLSFNYFQVIFSSSYSIGNFIFLFQFLTSIGIIAFTMLFFACTTKKACRHLYTARFVFIILNLLTLIMNIITIVSNGSVGNYLLLITILLYDILFLSLKMNRKAYILLDFE